MCKALAAVPAACLALPGNEALTAENYPTHALTMIVPFPAGGATDTVAHYLGGRIRPILGQSVQITPCTVIPGLAKRETRNPEIVARDSQVRNRAA